MAHSALEKLNSPRGTRVAARVPKPSARRVCPSVTTVAEHLPPLPLPPHRHRRLPCPVIDHKHHQGAEGRIATYRVKILHGPVLVDVILCIVILVVNPLPPPVNLVQLFRTPRSQTQPLHPRPALGSFTDLEAIDLGNVYFACGTLLTSIRIRIDKGGRLTRGTGRRVRGTRRA